MGVSEGDYISRRFTQPKISLSIDWFQCRATMLFEIGDDIKITVCD